MTSNRIYVRLLNFHKVLFYILSLEKRKLDITDTKNMTSTLTFQTLIKD